MIADPFYLQLIVSANADIAAAQENMSSDDPDYSEKHSALSAIQNQIEALIVREVDVAPKADVDEKYEVNDTVRLA